MPPRLPLHPPSPHPRRTLTLLVASPEGSSADPSTTTQAIAALPGVLGVTINAGTRTAFVPCAPRLVDLPRLHATVTSAAAETGQRKHGRAREPTE